MSNIFFGLNIGRSSLLTHQAALDVTGHNLANVETEGYSRQRVSLTTSLAIQTAQGPVGSGVNMDRIQRLQLGYLDRQIGRAMTQHSYDSTLVRGYDELQAVLGEPSSDGVGAALTEFWNSWEALSVRPADSSLRAQVLDRAENLALVFNQKMGGLETLEAEFETAIDGAVGDVNVWAEKIAALNVSIAQSEATGYTANDLRDQRELLSRRISEKLGVELETDGSDLNIRLPGGPYLVHRSESYDLQVTRNDEGQVTGLFAGAAPVSPQSGEIEALLTLRAEAAPGLRRELADLMSTVADRVNGLHHSGYDREGLQGLNLFQWQGQADSLAFAASAGLSEVGASAGLEAGTHHLSVSAVTLKTSATNGLGDQPAVGLTVAYQDPANPVFQGPQAIQLDYHVRVVSSNVAAGDPTGLRVQLYRGDEAVGDAQAVPASGSVVWEPVDGLVFSAAVDTSGSVLAAGSRSDGYSTVGAVSLDGGPAVAVDLTGSNGFTFVGGIDSGFLGGGEVTVDFSGKPFYGAPITRFGQSGRLLVNPLVAGDTDRLAAAAPSAAGAAARGDGEIARRMGALATGLIFEATGDTAAGALGRTVQRLGSAARDAQVFETASSAIELQVEAQRQSEVGVNVDEEMVQMLQYQRGFEAAARFLTTVDGLIDTLINRVGAG